MPAGKGQRRSRAAAILEDLRQGLVSVGGGNDARRQDVAEVANARSAMRDAKRRRIEAQEVARAVQGRRNRPGPKTNEELRAALSAEGADPLRLIEQYRENIEGELARKIAGEAPADDSGNADDDREDERVELFLALRRVLEEQDGGPPTAVRGVLRLAGVSAIPVPLDMTNLEVLLDPYMWVIYFDDVGVSEKDLSDRFRAVSGGGALGQMFTRDAKETLTVEGASAEPDSIKIISLRRLFLQLAANFANGDLNEPLTSFCLQNHHILKEARRISEDLYSDYATTAGLNESDLNISSKFLHVPAWAKTSTDAALKARFYGRQGNSKQKAKKTGEGKEKTRNKVEFDASKHILRGDIVHSKKADGSLGRPLGRKKG